jgi:hypothetical protein
MLQFWLERGGSEALLEDEADVASSYWLNGKEEWHSATVWRHRTGESRHRGEREETMTVGLTQILLGQKIKKIHTVDSADTNGWWKFKAAMS